MFKKLIGIAVLVTATLTSGCDRPSRSGPLVTIGVSPFQDTILPKLGAAKGWYEAQGLNVRFVVLGWTEINEALSAPESQGVDVAINNECGVISAHNRNKEIVYYYGINPFDNGFALMIRPSGDLKPLSYYTDKGMSRIEAVKAAASQLRGKTVITTSNTDMEQGVASAANKAGLNIGTDVKIINLPPEEGLAAFLNGKGDAYIGGVPQRLAAARAGDREMLTGADLGPPPINGFVTTSRFLQKHPEIMPKIMKVWFETVKYVNDNKEKAGEEVSSMLRNDAGVSVSQADFLQTWNHLESFPASPQEAAANILSPKGKNYWQLRWNDCNRYYLKIAHTIPSNVDPDGVFLMDKVQPEVEAAVGNR